MEKSDRAELESFLKISTRGVLLRLWLSSPSKQSRQDYILGVANPEQWHAENLKTNVNHYASWMTLLGGARLITQVADKIGGVHFNPFVVWNDKRYRYGVVQMHDLVQDITNWEKLYISGCLQKPVHILVDDLDIENVNSVNLRAAMSVALLLLPSKFTEVKKIVQGQFDLFQSRYKHFLEEYKTKELLRFLSSENLIANMSQDCGLYATRSLVSLLPSMVRSKMGMKLGEKKTPTESGKVIKEVVISSREKAAKCMQKVLKRELMISSVRQAFSGVVAAGGVNAARYLATKLQKAWKSWTR